MLSAISFGKSTRQMRASLAGSALALPPRDCQAGFTPPATQASPRNSATHAVNILEALNRITDERHRTSRSLAMIAREALEASKSPNFPMQIKSG
jgi:hypothetical protein